MKSYEKNVKSLGRNVKLQFWAQNSKPPSLPVVPQKPITIPHWASKSENSEFSNFLIFKTILGDFWAF